MALARALTTRIRRGTQEDGNSAPARGKKIPNHVIDRSKISLPVELISSTNNLAYDAPDIPSVSPKGSSESKHKFDVLPVLESPTSSASSTKSYEDSMKSPGLSSASSRTSAEMSRESSPVVSPKADKTFFIDIDKTVSSASAKADEVIKETSAPTSTQEQTPSVPQRAPSHTKKNHQTLARQRSERMSSPPPARQSGTRQSGSIATRTSMEFLSQKPDADHPFGAELQQVSELAEEFAAKDVQILDEDSQFMADHGFLCFSAQDYIKEIQPLFVHVYPQQQTWL